MTKHRRRRASSCLQTTNRNLPRIIKSTTTITEVADVVDATITVEEEEVDIMIVTKITMIYQRSYASDVTKAGIMPPHALIAFSSCKKLPRPKTRARRKQRN